MLFNHPMSESSNVISEMLPLQRVRFGSSAQSKKNAFEQIAELFAVSQEIVHRHDIFDGLVARERLGNTSLGYGVALPHCRLAHIEKPIACFIHFRKGIDYDAQDKLPVDLLFSLIVPEDAEVEHLNLLADISSLFHQETFRQSLRQAGSAKELYQRLTSAE